MWTSSKFKKIVVVILVLFMCEVEQVKAGVEVDKIRIFKRQDLDLQQTGNIRSFIGQNTALRSDVKKGNASTST